MIEFLYVNFIPPHVGSSKNLTYLGEVSIIMQQGTEDAEKVSGFILLTPFML